MSDIATGHEHVMVRPDTPDSTLGRTSQTLATVKASIEQDRGPAVLGLSIQELLDRPQDPTEISFDSLVLGGDRFLFGIDHTYTAQESRLRDSPYDAVLYALGLDQGADGAYGSVKVATWERRDVTLDKANDKMGRLESRLVDASLVDVMGESYQSIERSSMGGRFAAIPVNRLTEVSFVAQAEEPFIYGHRQDLRQIDGLDLPDKLKKDLTNTVMDFHDQEILPDSKPGVNPPSMLN